MAEIVLVHGIGQQQLSARTLKLDWVRDLAGGLENAGHLDLADTLQPDTDRVEMAFWGGLFLPPGKPMGARQGVEYLEEVLAGDPDLPDLMKSLAEEWLKASAAMDAHPDTRRAVEIALKNLDQDQGLAQGGVVSTAQRFARVMVKGFSSIPWFAEIGFGAAQLAIAALDQVSRYMKDSNLRQAVLDKVLPLLGGETKIIIGHSLGSVIAYDIARVVDYPLTLMVTMGSPLGIPNVVYDRLQPPPPTFPARLQHWLNVAAPDDIVAAVLDLRPLFTDHLPKGSTFEGIVVGNGSRPHSATHYLTKPEVGAAIAQALDPRQR